MAYDEILARRIRAVLEGQPALVEKKMFGGIGFLLHGNMACGINGEDLIVRVGPEHYSEALARPNTRQFDMTGRAMTGWVVVKPEGFETDRELAKWIQEGIDFARSLPQKE